MKQQLDATFERAKGIGPNPELQSDFARYLCVLVSGYIEKAVVEFILEHAREKGAPTLQRFVEQQTKNFTNPKASRVQDLLGSFEPSWRQELEKFLVDERKDAVDSIVSLRNSIAHGNSVGLTYSRIENYYQQAQHVIDRVAELCIPGPAGALSKVQRQGVLHRGGNQEQEIRQLSRCSHAWCDLFSARTWV